MAWQIENHCNHCDMPCINCGRKRVLVFFCDRCDPKREHGLNIEDIYDDDGEDVCLDCLCEAHGKEFEL